MFPDVDCGSCFEEISSAIQDLDLSRSGECFDWAICSEFQGELFKTSCGC